MQINERFSEPTNNLFKLFEIFDPFSPNFFNPDSLFKTIYKSL
jgi:hypothetical protein